MMKFCTQCGSPLDFGEKFCTNCGTPVQDTTSSPGLASRPPQETSPVHARLAVSINLLVILGVIAVIAVIAISATMLPRILQQSGPAGETPATLQGAFVILPETTPPQVPRLGVWVHVNYIGGWAGTYGMTGAQQSASDSGGIGSLKLNWQRNGCCQF